MALVECNNCGHKISSRARRCPKCAAPAQVAPPIASTPSPPPFAAKAAFAAAAASSFPIDRDFSFGPPDATAAQDAEEAHAPTQGVLARVLSRFKRRKPSEEEGEVEEVSELQAAPAELEEAENEDLYYLTGDGRTGPVPISFMYQMVSDGDLDLNTMVSRKGTSDWLTFAQYLKAKADEAASPKAGAGKGAGMIPWIVISSPLWGSAVPVVATQIWVTLGYRPLAYQAHLWWSVLLLVTAACCLDFRARKKAGEAVGAADLWLSLLVPVYLYRRQKSALSLLAAFTLLTLCCLAALGGFVLVNGYNAPILTVIERMDHVQRHLH
ncbi:GYF domain-containing protein [Geomonas sp. RF6]|uniref:GYF domain-containing protein n=1 Tax=Geomonas sp. RF6 TaxID=2897342 RepID=UPI001E3CF0D5|nr:GYF domain-containing protein [Geomonas sp. RF6]UFS69818.1 GYF domain-containing protein [Geomonas sp. RF6]